jgi:DNA-binding NarL/FixJ family response regulator
VAVPIARILVVDDAESFRRIIASILEQESGLQLVGEASDGRIAAEKADNLRPDLVLLDIALPSLNGLQAAREIRTRAPQSRILIVSQESSREIVQAALNLGARGYVHKMEAQRELLTAIKAVIRGEVYVSSMMRPDLIFPNGKA